MTRAVHLTDPSSGALAAIEVQPISLAPDQVRVAVARAGVNYWEVMQRRGRVRIAPGVALGAEGSGTVIEVGTEAGTLAVGDRVAWFRCPGSYADEVVGLANAFYRIPYAVDDDTAAGLLSQGSTAHYLTEETWPLAAGTRAAVTAASGGVGHLLVQLLVARGVEVVALVSESAKASVAEAAGASTVLTYDQARKTEDLTGACGAVFDAVGGDLPRDLLPWLTRRGCMVSYGSSSGHEADISAGQLTAGSYFMTRTAGKDYTLNADDARRRGEYLLQLASDGHLHVHVGHHYPLARARDALEALETRASKGKILLVP